MFLFQVQIDKKTANTALTKLFNLITVLTSNDTPNIRKSAREWAEKVFWGLSNSEQTEGIVTARKIANSLISKLDDPNQKFGTNEQSQVGRIIGYVEAAFGTQEKEKEKDKTREISAGENFEKLAGYKNLFNTGFRGEYKKYTVVSEGESLVLYKGKKQLAVYDGQTAISEKNAKLMLDVIGHAGDFVQEKDQDEKPDQKKTDGKKDVKELLAETIKKQPSDGRTPMVNGYYVEANGEYATLFKSKDGENYSEEDKDIGYFHASDKATNLGEENIGLMAGILEQSSSKSDKKTKTENQKKKDKLKTVPVKTEDTKKEEKTETKKDEEKTGEKTAKTLPDLKTVNYAKTLDIEWVEKQTDIYLLDKNWIKDMSNMTANEQKLYNAMFLMMVGRGWSATKQTFDKLDGIVEQQKLELNTENRLKCIWDGSKSLLAESMRGEKVGKKTVKAGADWWQKNFMVIVGDVKVDEKKDVKKEVKNDVKKEETEIELDAGRYSFLGSLYDVKDGKIYYGEGENNGKQAALDRAAFKKNAIKVEQYSEESEKKTEETQITSSDIALTNALSIILNKNGEITKETDKSAISSIFKGTRALNEDGTVNQNFVDEYFAGGKMFGDMTLEEFTTAVKNNDISNPAVAYLLEERVINSLSELGVLVPSDKKGYTRIHLALVKDASKYLDASQIKQVNAYLKLYNMDTEELKNNRDTEDSVRERVHLLFGLKDGKVLPKSERVIDFLVAVASQQDIRNAKTVVKKEEPKKEEPKKEVKKEEPKKEVKKDEPKKEVKKEEPKTEEDLSSLQAELDSKLEQARAFCNENNKNTNMTSGEITSMVSLNELINRIDNEKKDGKSYTQAELNARIESLKKYDSLIGKYSNKVSNVEQVEDWNGAEITNAQNTNAYKYAKELEGKVEWMHTLFSTKFDGVKKACVKAGIPEDKVLDAIKNFVNGMEKDSWLQGMMQSYGDNGVTDLANAVAVHSGYQK